MRRKVIDDRVLGFNEKNPLLLIVLFKTSKTCLRDFSLDVIMHCLDEAFKRHACTKIEVEVGIFSGEELHGEIIR